MARAIANDIEIEYAVHGDPSHPVVLFIMGLGAQMTAWDQDFINRFVDEGFCVITYDNRDVGLSTWFDEHGEVDVLPFLLGESIEAPYSLAHMAADGIAVLDTLGIEQAHILGISMGGMIAQQLVIDHPHRTITLTSIMSTTGAADVGQPTPEAIASLMTPPATTRDEAIETGVDGWRIISSVGYPFEEEDIRRRTGEAYDRAYHPVGTNRQLAAILASGDRTEALRSVTAPTLVLHGEADPLVTPTGGEATAAAVPGARHLTYPGMGHDLPRPLWNELVQEITGHLRSV